jgi:hypothetical protein
MTKLPTTLEEYQALTDEERAEVHASFQATMEQATSFMVAVVGNIQIMADLIAAWVSALPPDVQDELERLAMEKHVTPP